MSLGIIPLIISICKKQGWYDPVDPRKVHSGNIPRLGSIGFVPSFLIIAAIYLLTISRALFLTALPVFIAGLFVFILGVLDDFRDLRVRLKVLGQFVACIIPVACGFQITQIGALSLGIAGPFLTFFWLLAITNAMNLIDGVDALCGSIAFFILLTLGCVLSGNSEYGGLTFILAGGVLGFLFYNRPKAKIFMGDGGSQFLGFMIAVLPLFKLPQPLPVDAALFPMMILLLSIPILDTIAAIWRRTREQRTFFSADKSHLHHKLMNLGYTTVGILSFLLIIQMGLCLIAAFAVLMVEGVQGLIILCIAFAAMIVFFAIIHYTNQSVTGLKGTGGGGGGGGGAGGPG
ncbi:MAG: undecaprenyl/decaprenyl-phosphate alpha-N-acetylglucosaminyl 1-phosphate transferase, partial [Treponema sp.]|nr:undecaprenyl/decaprenyl-phosphate alpha-N-acetylglucosaminyl 1-phosphate transferase [Treponema sp.]